VGATDLPMPGQAAASQLSDSFGPAVALAESTGAPQRVGQIDRAVRDGRR
jgi:hypothetical protein